jgi:two-component sensor histidine kinase
MEKVVASERSKTLLLQEVAHRTKNNLAMLSAMVRLQSRTLGQEASDALEDTSQRIQTMAEVYDHLMLRDQTKIVDLKEYIGDIVRRLMALSGDKPVAVRCELDEAYAHSEVAVPIAIIINELVTNSIKYGFPDERAGQILIRLHSAGDELDDRFHETGIEKPTSMELEGHWSIPRLRRAERGATSWQHGGKRLRW